MLDNAPQTPTCCCLLSNRTRRRAAGRFRSRRLVHLVARPPLFPLHRISFLSQNDRSSQCRPTYSTLARYVSHNRWPSHISLSRTTRSLSIFHIHHPVLESSRATPQSPRTCVGMTRVRSLANGRGHPLHFLARLSGKRVFPFMRESAASRVADQVVVVGSKCH